MGAWKDSDFDRVDNGYLVQTNYHNERPSFALLRALAVLMDCEMRNLPPLDTYFDLGAFDRLFSIAYETEQDVTAEVEIEDYTAVVRDDGTILVHEDESADETTES